MSITNPHKQLQPQPQFSPQQVPLAQALSHVDKFLLKIESIPTPATVSDVKTVLHQTRDIIAQHCVDLNQDLTTYHKKVLEDKALAMSAQTDSTTDLHVKRAQEELNLAKKHLHETELVRIQQQTIDTKIRHDIESLERGDLSHLNDNIFSQEEPFRQLPSEYSPSSYLDNNINGNSKSTLDEITQLEQEHALITGKLNIMQLLSHLSFTDGGLDDNPNVIKGFMTLTNIADLRPFEIDISKCTPEQIQEMIWGWLYDEYC